MTGVFLLALLFAEPVFPTHQGLVTDTAAMLTAAQREELARALLDYRTRSTNVIAILTVPTLDGLTVDEYANKIFHTWGIGDRQKDNGILLLWAIKERALRIEVGYGLEANLPDGRAGQIIREDIAPRFRQQQWYGGLQAGTQAIIAQLDRQQAEALAPRPSSTNWPLILFGLVVVIGVVVLAIVLFVRRARRDEVLTIGSTSRPDYTGYRSRPRVSSRPSSSRSYTSSSDYSYTPSRSSWSSSSDSYSPSSSSASTSSDAGSYSGGDSGGGGASGSY